jgi:putative ABC transport system substrate-binding protein
MKRREFLGLVGSAGLALPMAVRAQQPGKIYRIGILGPSRDAPVTSTQYQAFGAELDALGFSEGRNLAIDYQRIDGAQAPLVAAQELAKAQPDLFWANGPEAALQAVIGASGSSVPIIFLAVNFDPIERGYVKTLAQPGGNVTGVFIRQPELAAKQVDILTQAFPEWHRLGVLWDEFSTDQFTIAERATQSRGLDLRSLKLESPPYDFAGSFQALAARGTQMTLVLSSPNFTEHRAQVAEAARSTRMPTMFVFRSYVVAGGLMSYGVDQLPLYRRVAAIAAKILSGARPADIPVEQASKFELVVNLKTAKAIGVEIPAAILLRADEVIE